MGPQDRTADEIIGEMASVTWGLVRRPEVLAAGITPSRFVADWRSGFCCRNTATWRKVPVTSLARTLVDLAAVLSVNDSAPACHEAGVRYRTTPAHVQAVLGLRRNWPGAKKLREILCGDASVTLSELESAFLLVLEDENLPPQLGSRPPARARGVRPWG
jgi:hypothetical protein